MWWRFVGPGIHHRASYQQHYGRWETSWRATTSRLKSSSPARRCRASCICSATARSPSVKRPAGLFPTSPPETALRYRFGVHRQLASVRCRVWMVKLLSTSTWSSFCVRRDVFSHCLWSMFCRTWSMLTFSRCLLTFWEKPNSKRAKKRRGRSQTPRRVAPTSKSGSYLVVPQIYWHICI